MKFSDLVQKRQSVRAYNSSKQVDTLVIEQCIESARLAPSACNSQPWKFVVVNEASKVEKMAGLLKNKVIGLNVFSEQVPVFIVLVSEEANFTAKFGSVFKNKPYSLIDLGIAAEHFCLQAEELGLGTCIIGWFDEDGVKKLLDIPKKKRVFLVISVGYPSEKNVQRNKIRKNTDEILSYNKY
jgi:nitroreductase